MTGVESGAPVASSRTSCSDAALPEKSAYTMRASSPVHATCGYSVSEPIECPIPTTPLGETWATVAPLLARNPTRKPTPTKTALPYWGSTTPANMATVTPTLASVPRNDA